MQPARAEAGIQEMSLKMGGVFLPRLAARAAFSHFDHSLPRA